MKELTEYETYGEALHALRRLKVKELIAGPFYQDGRVCAIGALNFHSNRLRRATNIIEAHAVPSTKMRFVFNVTGIFSIVACNEDFAGDDNNSIKTCKARYNHVYNWLKEKMRSMGGADGENFI